MLLKKKIILLTVIGVTALLMGIPTGAMSADSTGQAGDSKAMELLEALNIGFGGLVEVEAAYVDDSSAPGDTSEVTLATVEIGVDAAPVKHVSARVLFLFEEGDTDPIDVDEAYIRLDGEDKLPLNLIAGSQYLPFGNFESHFISDPLTLELGETRESSIVAGYNSDMLEVALGVFNGDVEETGESNDHIDGYTAALKFTPPTGDRFGLTTGLSYISNIGDSDGLQGEDGIDADAGNTIDSHVPGLAAFASVSFMENIFLEVEVVAALDDFVAGQLGFDNGQAFKPVAYNTELIYQVNERLAAGVRLAGSTDGGSFLPEIQYGAVVSYTLFDRVAMGLECQYGEYDTPGDTDVTTVTAQLGVEF